MSKVLFLGQLLGISTSFPVLWLPAVLWGQGSGVTSTGRIWMALLLLVPITLVECLRIQRYQRIQRLEVVELYRHKPLNSNITISPFYTIHMILYH